MLIQVTAEDIAKGVRISCAMCPVAKAIRRTTGENKVSVGYGLIRWGSQSVRIETVAGVEDFITRFDNMESVEPFEFEL